jgi:hypothetical protein
MTAQTTPISAALRPILDLEAVLEQLLDQHRKLLAQINAHHAAMTKLDLPAMEQTRTQQHAARSRILVLEKQRIGLNAQIARMNKSQVELKLAQLAELYPARKSQLLRLRGELKSVVAEAARRNFISSKLSAAVLGHLNTAVRILARAVGDVGVYNGRGLATVSKRLGRMEITG